MRTHPRTVVTAIAGALIVTGAIAAQTPVDPAGGPTTDHGLGALEYRMIGPSRGGRVTAVAGHRAQPATFYMGATGGGVWKTTDYGQRWFNVSDGYFATPSIGAIAVAETNPDILYVSTGSDGLRSNVIIGKGVYKSVDAGATWTHVGLERTGNTGAVLIHPRNPDLVYVAAIGNPFAANPERGVYRTKDGGVSWERVLHVSDRTGAVDLEFAPDDPGRIYATMWLAERKPWTIISGGEEGGVYRSTDGGDSWSPLAGGLPTGLRGKADLAVSAADPNRVYVLIEAPAGEGGVYRSDDRGDTWSLVSTFQPILNRPFYYCNLEAHPTNADILWGMAEGQWRSDDAGKTWNRQETPHGDNHDMWINPDDPDLYIQANDGGANVTLNDGQTWSTQFNQPTAELYQVDVSDDFPYRLYAGQQDNTTISMPSQWPRSMPGGHTALWEEQGGCETGPAVPKPGDPDIVYADCKGRFGVFNRRTGQEEQYYVGFWNIYGHNPKDLAYRFQRVAPIHVSPHDANRVYHTSQYVHVTEDRGRTWQTISPDLTAFTPETQVVSGSPITIDVTGEEHFSVIYEIQESPHERGVIWVGSNDGPIHLTRDNGAHWTDVTPPGLGPYGRVQTIEVSPHQPSKAYASILRYQLGDFAPYAYRTTDYGATWTRLTSGANGIPEDYPVRVVREDPDRAGLLYAGTEYGMFVSFDDGSNWQPFQQNLPVTPVTDIKIVDKDLVLSTMGRGFWIMYDVTPLHEWTPGAVTTAPHLFQVKDPYRLRTRANPDPAPDEPRFPAPGANLDYRLPAEVTGPVTIDILDADGRLVRRFSSDAAANPSPQGLTQESWSLAGVGTAKLPASAGLHRIQWDLRYPGPWSASAAQSGRRGPMVPPGTYQAKLSVGDWSQTVSFEAKMDPRVVDEAWVTDADVQAQVELALAARDALSNARLAVVRLEEAEKAKPGHAGLAAVRAGLVTDPVRYSRPMLVDQLLYLYSNLDTADQRPGKDAVDRYQELLGALDAHVTDLRTIIGRSSDAPQP